MRVIPQAYMESLLDFFSPPERKLGRVMPQLNKLKETILEGKEPSQADVDAILVELRKIINAFGDRNGNNKYTEVLNDLFILEWHLAGAEDGHSNTEGDRSSVKRIVDAINRLALVLVATS